ncbi:sensor histidine kinase [Butyrivibrio sp. JL13D10]|uniref:sensor histidine kinase n=1 Tax=Butyrivibrio sp. JL13D10 TaxID=3236815 RepID=UPI0038B5D248
MKIKKYLIRFINIFRINSKFTLIILALTFIPIAIFSGVLFYNLENDAIKESHNYMESKIIRDLDRIETNVESINMSTRFFLSDEGLVTLLTDACKNRNIDIKDILEFYNTEIADLERLVNNNPLLYSVRVFSVTDNVQEMMPILYSSSRMHKLDWANNEEMEGWHFGYNDTIFSSLISDQNNTLASLVTKVEDYDNETIGYIEASMTMDSMFPGVYENIDGEWSFFTDNDGNILFCQNEECDEKDIINAFNEPIGDKESQVIYYKNSGRYITIGRYAVKAMNGVMYSVQDITENIVSVYRRRNMFVFIMTIVLLITCVLIDRMVRNFKKEVLSKNSEIRFLQNQINAHFIYNVLEAIKMMAEIEEKYEISDAITSLGKLMRYSIKSALGTVRLSDELEYIKSYILLINLRYDFEVILSFNIPENLMNQEILKMSLQPIVENAVLHGIEPVAEDTTVYIKAWEEDDDFKIEITDSGKGMDKDTLSNLMRQIKGEVEETGGDGNGIGLKNVEDRIKLYFGDEYGLRIYSEPDKFTKVSIVLPRKTYFRKSISK